MSYLRTFDAWADGVKQTFNPDATSAGFNFGAQAADPSVLVNGDAWYQSTANELRARINGVTVALGASGASPPFTDSNALVAGSGDPTKLMRFEVDGFTTATTRVLTVPNSDFTIAGLELTNVFTATQTVGTSNEIVLNPDGSASFANGGTALIITADGSLTVGSSVFSADVTTGFVALGGSILVDTVAATLSWGGGNSFLDSDGSIAAGIIITDVTATALAFFNATPVPQQTGVSPNLTNNATGGTADTIETLGQALYATDAATIEGNFNQLASKVNQIIIALQNYGLLVP